MKNSNEFTPIFNNKSDNAEEDVPESLSVFEASGDAGRQGKADAFVPTRKNPETFRRLETLRRELAGGAAREDRSQKPETIVPAAPLGVGLKTEAAKSSGKFRKFVHLALAGLGFLVGNKVSGEDLSVGRAQLDAKNVPPPIFKAPAEPGTGTNVYRYDQRMWSPTTPEGVAKAEKDPASRETQVRQGSGTSTIGQRPVQNTNQFMNAGVRPETNRNQQINPGSFPNPAGPQFMYGGNYPEPVRSQFPNGGNYPRQEFPRGSNFQYPNPLPDVVYYGVGPGEQIPTEKRKLFGKEYEAITRNSALYGGDTDRWGGNRGGKEAPRPPKKPKSP